MEPSREKTACEPAEKHLSHSARLDLDVSGPAWINSSFPKVIEDSHEQKSLYFQVQTRSVPYEVRRGFAGTGMRRLASIAAILSRIRE
jgi:hypothetical protein